MFTKNYYNAVAYRYMNAFSNYLDYVGDPTTVPKSLQIKTSGGSLAWYTSSYTPLGSFAQPTERNGATSFYPDITDDAPTLDDYVFPESDMGSNNKWIYVTHTKSIDSYDADTGEYTAIVKYGYVNNTGSEQTVHGLYIVERNNWDGCLVGREQFASPVTVPANGTLELSLTYKVSKAGAQIVNSSGT